MQTVLHISLGAYCKYQVLDFFLNVQVNRSSNELELTCFIYVYVGKVTPDWNT